MMTVATSDAENCALMNVFPKAVSYSQINANISKFKKYACGNMYLCLKEIEEIFQAYNCGGLNFLGCRSRHHVSVAEKILLKLKDESNIDIIMQFIADERSKLNTIINTQGDFSTRVDYLFYRYSGKDYSNYANYNIKNNEVIKSNELIKIPTLERNNVEELSSSHGANNNRSSYSNNSYAQKNNNIHNSLRIFTSNEEELDPLDFPDDDPVINKQRVDSVLDHVQKPFM